MTDHSTHSFGDGHDHGPCPTCGHHWKPLTDFDPGIDPLRLVGVGSVLEGRGKASDQTLRRVIVTMVMPPLCAVQAVWHADDWGKAHRVVIDSCDIGPGKPWSVVRAVPPMREEDDR